MPNKKRGNDSDLQQVQERDSNVISILTSSLNETKNCAQKLQAAYDDNKGSLLAMQNIIEILVKRIEKIESENKILIEKVESLEVTQENLKRQINEQQQDKISSHMEISGIPSTIINSSENPKVIAEEALSACNISFEKSSIVRAYKRIVNIHNEPTTIITAVFNNYDEKLRIMKLKRARNKNGTIFLNHALTQTNRSLFVQAKKLCKNSKFYSFIANGQIFIRKENESQSLKIRSTDDLKNFIRTKIQHSTSLHRNNQN